MSPRRTLLIAAAALCGAILIVGIIVIGPWRGHGSVSPFPTSSTASTVPEPTSLPSTASGTASPAPKPSPSIAGQGHWPTYGYDDARTRFNPTVTGLRPPYHVKWRRRVGELLEFPPAIDRDMLFLTTNGGQILGLDARTGRRIWHRHYGFKFASSPTVSDGVVYVTSMNGWLFALDRDTGKGIWRHRYGSPSESSPLLWHGMVIAGCWNGTLYAVSLTSHKVVWRVRTGGKITSSPAVYDGRLVFGSYDGSVYCVNHRGKRLWTFHPSRYFVASDSFYATPAIAYDTVYIGGLSSRFYAIDLITGNQRWSTGAGSWVYSSAAVAGGRVYVGSYARRFYCFSARSGRLLWSVPTTRPISGSASVIDGIAYFSSLARRTYGVNARTGRVVWRFGDGRYSPAAAGGSILYVVGQNALYALVPK